MTNQLEVTAKQLRRIAYERKITRWTADHCPVCDYPYVYLFDSEGVQHDPGCSCTDETARVRWNKSSWEEVADYINKQIDVEQIRLIKKFWYLSD